MQEGRFDFHDYVDHVSEMLRAIGGRPHVVAVCQPGPPVMAAAALMAEDGDPCRPASTTYMGSPIDARLAPTQTNDLAAAKPFAWFQDNMIYTVPAPYPGMMRRVYPGFVQLYSFMSMNEDRHREAHQRHFASLVPGDGDASRSTTNSTTSICRCWTSRRSSTSRPSTLCSSATAWPRASWSTAGGPCGRRRSPISP
jgi:poly(3-hydroxybutyrate) depolymerase